MTEDDEWIRDDTTAEALAALTIQPNTAQMTAGNSSSLNDGASAFAFARPHAAEKSGVDSLVRMVSAATHALDRAVMGIVRPIHRRLATV